MCDGAIVVGVCLRVCAHACSIPERHAPHVSCFPLVLQLKPMLRMLTL